MNAPVTLPSVILTIGDIRRWKAERDSLTAEIASLTAKREALTKRLEAATLFVHPDLVTEIFGASDGATPPADEDLDERVERGSWTGLLESIITKSERGLLRSELRDEVLKSHLGERLKISDKSFHGALLKLERRGIAVRHGQKVFSADAFKRFEEAVAAGIIEDDTEESASGSPFTEAAYRFICSRPNGCLAAEVKDHMRSMPEFVRSIDRNQTHMYNVLSKLVKRGRVRKEDRTYYPPSKKNGPSNALTLDGPNAGSVND